MNIYLFEIDYWIESVKNDALEFNETKYPFVDFFSKQENLFEGKYRNKKFEANIFKNIVFKFRSKKYLIAKQSFSFPSYTYFVHKNFLKILENDLCMPPIQYWPINAMYRDEELEGYYVLIFWYDLFNDIDYKLSRFNLVSKKNMFNPILIESDFEINTEEQYKSWMKPKPYEGYEKVGITISEIVFKENVYKYDCFPLPRLEHRLHVSEKFKDKISILNQERLRFHESLLPIGQRLL
jgi:hypothetical protein